MRVHGNQTANILVVTECPQEEGMALAPDERRFFRSVAETYGFSLDDFAFLPCARPMPEDCVGQADQSAHLARDRDEFLERYLECDPAMIIVLGNHALRQVSGRAMQIGKARGQVHELPGIAQPVLPMYGVRQCLWFPENIDMFVSDFNMVANMDDNGYDPHAMGRAVDVDYQWTLDLSELLDDRPSWMAVDTETTGLKWVLGDRVLTVQLTPRTGVSRVVPVDMRAARIVYPDMSDRALTRAVGRAKQQLRTLLTDGNIRKIGHNIKFDHHHVRESLGYKIENWFADTQQLAFVVDDNMPEKSLDETTRRWVPEMAGYADEFNRTANKADMLGELRKDPDKFLRYAAQDTDANYRAAKVLVKLAQQDADNWRCYRYIQLPTLLAMADKIEPNGLRVDVERLAELEIEVERETERLHNAVLAQIPAKVRRRHLIDGLKLTRPALKIDALFSNDGLGLEPLFFTKGTRHKPDNEKVPTVGKDHLTYHAHHPLVHGLMEWGKYDKMRTTYVGKAYDPDKGMPTGFWQHIVRRDDGSVYIHPSFFLHRTKTGRTASSDPNAQNFPKRGDLAKAFRSIFIAPPGYKLVEVDLSQAELRIAGVQARESEMIRLYNEGVDIHMNTAAAVARTPVSRYIEHKRDDTRLMEVANDWPGSGAYLRQLGNNERQEKTVADFIAMQRFRAKAVNFGFLYGMQWRGFQIYAKTDYGLDYTEQEAQDTRALFFDAYPGLISWHEEMERDVYEHGYVRALHGAMRRLPSIYSNRRSVQMESVRQAINSPIQRFASDLGIMALWRLSRDCPDWIQPVAFIHDALIAYVREDRVEEGARNIIWYMENNPLEDWFGLNMPLPILADASIGDRLSEMDEREDLHAECPDWYRPELDEEPQYVFH